jgi:hypothetical protein
MVKIDRVRAYYQVHNQHLQHLIKLERERKEIADRNEQKRRVNETKGKYIDVYV